MLKYEQSTLYQDKFKGNNWYVYVTIPLELRRFLKNQKQKKLSTKTTDIRIAKDRQREIEAKIYQKLDEANSGNHPLAEVAEKLQELIFKEVKYPTSDWFDPAIRMISYNGLRDQARRVLGLGTGEKNKTTHIDAKGNEITLSQYMANEERFKPIRNGKTGTDSITKVFALLTESLARGKPDGENQYHIEELPEDIILDVEQPSKLHTYDKDGHLLQSVIWDEKDESTYIGETQYAHRIAPTVSQLVFKFETEFAKVSSEKFAPKKRSITFREAMDNYFNSSAFEKISRIKTQDDYKNRAEKFLNWAGNITLEDIDMKLGSDFVEALCKTDSKLCEGGASNAIVKKFMTPLKNVFQFALEQGQIKYKPWADLKIADKGRPPQERLAFSDYQMKELFNLEMPEEDRLLLSIMASTGCRLDEAALLEWDDLKEQEQEGELVHFIDLKRINAILKNKSAQRHLPIIPQVWAMFPQQRTILNEAEPERIFTYKRDKDGKAQNKASRRNMKHVRKITLDERYTVYSLRHKFISLCRGINMDTELRNFIVGQDIGKKSIGANYGEEHHIKLKLDNMAKIDWSFLTPTT